MDAAIMKYCLRRNGAAGTTPLLLIGIVLLLGPTVDFRPELTWHDQQRVQQILLIALLTIGALTYWRRPIGELIERLPTLARNSLAIAFALGAVSAALSRHPHYAALEWASVLLLIVVCFTLAAQSRAQGEYFDRWAIRALITVAALIAFKVGVIYLAITVENLPLNSVDLFSGSFSNRRFFGQAASMIIPLLAWPLLRNATPPYQRVSMFALLGIWWMLAMASGTRGTWLALFAAAIFVALVAWPLCRPWLRVQAVGICLGGALLVLLFMVLPLLLGQQPTLENRFSDIVASRGRGALWESAWHHILANPWLGIGPMHFAVDYNGIGAHPHNALLQLGAEWGTFATIAFVIPVILGLHAWLSRLRQQEMSESAILWLCLSVSLIAAATHSMVDGITVIPYSQTLLIFITGWMLGMYFRPVLDMGATQPDNTLTPGGATSRWTLGVITALGLLVLVYSAFPAALHRAEVDQTYLDTREARLLPRFWAQGWIP